LALVLAVVAAAELIFGSWISGEDYRLLNLPRNERRTFDVSAFVPDSPIVHYTRDALGFRGDYGDDPRNIDVVVLGGSTTNERYVTDAQTWVTRLQENFRNAGIPLHFANAAIDGQSTVGHVAAIDLWLSKISGLRPRYALVYVGINDMAVDPTQSGHGDLMKSPEGLRRIRHYVMNHSAVYDLFRTVRGSMQARDAQLMHGGRYRDAVRWRPVVHDDAEALRSELSARLRAYAERLAILADRLRTANWQPIFITQPRGDFRMIDGVLHALSLHGETKPPTDRGLRVQELFNDVTRASCETLAIRCVDLARDIKTADEDFYDPIHTTPAGSQKIADLLFGELKDDLKPRP
jgi:lysophospholipase L1-like esterase